MIRLLSISAAVLVLSACDAIRFPGDGRGTPQPAPPPREEPTNLPDGAPGPPPPAAPVEDPYGSGAPTGPVDEPDTETPDSDPASETETDVEPVTGDASGSETEPAAPTDPADETEPEETDQSEDPAEPVPTQPDGAADPSDDGATPTVDREPPVEDTTDPETPNTGDQQTEEIEPEAPIVTDPEPEVVVEPAFSYDPPGMLFPGSGQGAADETVYAPGIVFPIKDAPTYLQSMVWRLGGGIGGGDECDPQNYAYPWQDNFCEMRSSNRNTPFCPTGRIHQGQDIRVGTAQGCNQQRRTTAADRTLYEVVAVEDGVISNIGSYTVNLRAPGRIYRYMHMNMARLEVALDQQVKAGDVLGYVSKDFGGTPTTFHLHFEMIQNTAGHGWVHVPPYLSLVEAYERREQGPGERMEPNLAIASSRAVLPVPEGFEIIE